MKKTILTLLYLSCVEADNHGTLLVTGQGTTEFTIFRVIAKEPLKLLAEQAGHLNKPVTLPAGNYLLFADCSYRFVTIKPAIVTELPTYTINFSPPHRPQGKFAVQCPRFSQTNSRQQFANKFEFQLLSRRQKLLVAALSLTAVFQKGQHRISYRLAALKVARPPTIKTNERFFVSPQDSLLSVSSSQTLGEWLYLLPGNYIVEFNGKNQTISLTAGQQLIITPALLEISSTKAIADYPPTIDGQGIVPVNEPFATLAGSIALTLSINARPLPIILDKTTPTIITARSLQITSNCARNDFACLHTSKVYLYQKNENVPFLITTSDRRVLFARQKVRVAIEGSEQLTQQLADNQRDTVLALGTLQLTTNIINHPTRFTDLIRLETIAPNSNGQSLDLSRVQQLQLLAGHYRLAHYTSPLNPEGIRKKHSTPLTITAGRTHDLTLKVLRLADK